MSTAAPQRRRGIATVDDLRAWSVVDPATHCWIWQKPMAPSGPPRIHTFCHRHGDKRVMSGPAAVWNIAHGDAPSGIVYRPCWRRECVNPAHHRMARDTAEMMRMLAGAGRLRGTSTEQRRANLLLARAAAGIVDTPPELVAQVRAAGGTETGSAIAARLGLNRTVVSRILRRLSHKEVRA